ncbi:MAG: hypothetical protein ABIJ09_05440 [Pseudomonadota bacterium]
MDDIQLRARIHAVLEDYDRSWWRYWAQHIAVSSAAAGMMLGLAACPRDLMPPGPDAAAAVSRPVMDPDITSEYAVSPDWQVHSQPAPVPPYSVPAPAPARPDMVPVSMYAALEPRPMLPDPNIMAEYAVREPLPAQPEPQLPVTRPASKYGIPADMVARPAYAIEPEALPPPSMEGVARPLYSKQLPKAQPTPQEAPSSLPAPDLGTVARYGVRLPSPPQNEALDPTRRR